jgi:hypothetical protein
MFDVDIAISVSISTSEFGFWFQFRASEFRFRIGIPILVPDSKCSFGGKVWRWKQSQSGLGQGISSLRWDAKIEKFDTKTKFKKQTNGSVRCRNLRSIEWYQKHMCKFRETIPLRSRHNKPRIFFMVMMGIKRIPFRCRF